jgi:hypothetical protein
MSLCVFAAVFKPRVFSHFKLVRILAEVGLTIELCMILLPVGQHFHVRRTLGVEWSVCIATAQSVPLFQFQFVNSFLSLFYIAFYLQDMEKLKEVSLSAVYIVFICTSASVILRTVIFERIIHTYFHE